MVMSPFSTSHDTEALWPKPHNTGLAQCLACPGQSNACDHTERMNLNLKQKINTNHWFPPRLHYPWGHLLLFCNEALKKLTECEKRKVLGNWRPGRCTTQAAWYTQTYTRDLRTEQRVSKWRHCGKQSQTIRASPIPKKQAWASAETTYITPLKFFLWGTLGSFELFTMNCVLSP